MNESKINELQAISFLSLVSEEIESHLVWDINYSPFEGGVFLTVTYTDGSKESKKIHAIRKGKMQRESLYWFFKSLVFSSLVRQDFFKYLFNVSLSTISKDISDFKLQLR